MRWHLPCFPSLIISFFLLGLAEHISRSSPPIAWSEGLVFVVGEEAFGFGVEGESFAVGDVSGAKEWGEFAGWIEVGCA